MLKSSREAHNARLYGRSDSQAIDGEACETRPGYDVERDRLSRVLRTKQGQKAALEILLALTRWYDMSESGPWAYSELFEDDCTVKQHIDKLSRDWILSSFQRV